MAREFSRADRLAEQIQREIGTLLLFEIENPLLKRLTVSGVDVSRDLAYAKVFITRSNFPLGAKTAEAATDASSEDASGGARVAPVDDGEQVLSARDEVAEERDILAALGRTSGYFRRTLAGRLRVRAVPELRFEIDKTLDEAARIERLLAGS